MSTLSMGARTHSAHIPSLLCKAMRLGYARSNPFPTGSFRRLSQEACRLRAQRPTRVT